MRPHRGAVCAEHDASRSCRARYDAVAKGRFFWQDFVGWIWLDSIDPTSRWEFCPWCAETLPALAEEDDPLEDVRQADGFDGEDGG